MRPDAYHIRSPEALDVYSEEASNTNTLINRVIVSERGAIILILALLAVICGIALVRSESAKDESSKAEREARMLQYYVLEMDAKLIAAGVKKPEEAIAKQQESKP